MTPVNAAQKYQDNHIMSATPAETALLLFDGALRFLRSAIQELEKDNIPEKAKLIEKVVNILDYLHSCLDKEKGGEIAVNLERLYSFMMIELTDANLKNNRKKMEIVIELIQPIRDAWAEICSNAVPVRVEAGKAHAENYKAPEREPGAPQKIAVKA